MWHICAEYNVHSDAALRPIQNHPVAPLPQQVFSDSTADHDPGPGRAGLAEAAVATMTGGGPLMIAGPHALTTVLKRQPMPSACTPPSPRDVRPREYIMNIILINYYCFAMTVPASIPEIRRRDVIPCEYV